MRTLLCLLCLVAFLSPGMAQPGWEQLPTPLAPVKDVVHAGGALQMTDGHYLYRLPDGDTVWQRKTVPIGLHPIRKLRRGGSATELEITCQAPYYSSIGEVTYFGHTYRSTNGGNTWSSASDCEVVFRTSPFFGFGSGNFRTYTKTTATNETVTIHQTYGYVVSLTTVQIDTLNWSFDDTDMLLFTPTEMYLRHSDLEEIYVLDFSSLSLDTIPKPLIAHQAFASSQYLVTFPNRGWSSDFVNYRERTNGSWKKLALGVTGHSWSAVGSNLYYASAHHLYRINFEHPNPIPELVWTAPEPIASAHVGADFALVRTGYRMYVSLDIPSISLGFAFRDISRGLPRTNDLSAYPGAASGSLSGSSYHYNGWNYTVARGISGFASNQFGPEGYQIQRNTPISAPSQSYSTWGGLTYHMGKAVFGYRNIIIIEKGYSYAISTDFGVTFRPFSVPWQLGFHVSNDGWFGTGFRRVYGALLSTDGTYLYARTGHNQGTFRRPLAYFYDETPPVNIAEGSKLRGCVFEDLNENCRPDAGEPRFADFPVVLRVANPVMSPDWYRFDTVYTDASGTWTNETLLGNVTFSTELPDGYVLSCGAEAEMERLIRPNRTNRVDFPLRQFMLPPAIGSDAPKLGTSVFPNPFTEQLNIRAEDPTMTWTILDPAGMAVAMGDAANRRSISTDHLAPGIYLVRVSTASEVKSFKMVKQ